MKTSRTLAVTAILLFAVRSVSGALETELGAYLDFRQGFLFGDFQASALDAFTHGNPSGTSPLFSPSGGGGAFADFYFTPVFGAGGFISIEVQNGGVSVAGANGSTIGAVSLDELTLQAGVRALQRFKALNGRLFLSEGFTGGIVPMNINLTYKSASAVTRTMESPRAFASRLFIGGELRAGYSWAMGPGFASAGVRLDVLNLPTDVSGNNGASIMVSPGIEIGYAVGMDL